MIGAAIPAIPTFYVMQAASQDLRQPPPERVVDVPTRPGQFARALVSTPEAPKASIILLAGGHGNIDLGSDGRIGWGERNQLVRTRRDYAARGLATIVPDIARDLKAGSGTVDAYRWSEVHALDLAALTAFAAQLAKPVYLVGTSRAALSVANLASRPDLKPQPDALVITSGMLMDVGLGQPSVQRNVLNLERIRAPLLALFHQDDRCVYTPASTASAFRGLVGGASFYDIKLLSGGLPPQSDPCEALSAHGFLGLDREVVDTIVEWLTSRPRT